MTDNNLIAKAENKIEFEARNAFDDAFGSAMGLFDLLEVLLE